MPAPEAAPEAGAPAPSLRQALLAAATRLRRAAIDNPGDDARRLAAAVLGLTSAELLSAPERPLAPEEVARLDRAIARRVQREPTARIIGARDFYGHSFALSSATLEPRPDSETLIIAALQLAREEGWLAAPLRILDVGTGSGCLLLTLLLELVNATGVGTDISASALATARENAAALDVAHRSRFVAADALDAIAGKFDIMVSNPPYIRSADIGGLEPEVRCYDPRAALDGGSDGLALFRRLAAGMARVVPDGWIIVEVGHDQADAVAGLLAAAAIGVEVTMRTFRDVAGRRRCVALRTRISCTELMIDAETP
jgi:release factor glutamine methyltransferase